MKLVLHLAILTAAVATVVLPATASGHGSVYTDTARIDTNLAPGPFTLADQVRHVVTNHGYTKVLRETNGANSKGMVDYSRLPGDYRVTIPGSQVLAEGDTAAQPHATCRGVPALETEDAIRGWQDGDPFYNYVPFQKLAAGLEDDPALWREGVLTLTGVDLGQVSDVPAQAALQLEALCEGPTLGGMFYLADETQTSTASLNSGFAHDLTTPLTVQIAQQVATMSSLEGENNALKAQVAQLKLEATRLAIKSVSGGSVKLTGPAGKAVTVKVTISQKVAKALRLKSRTLATASGKLGADATATLTVKPKGKAATALKKKGSAKVTVKATSEDRVASTGATLKG